MTTFNGYTSLAAAKRDVNKVLAVHGRKLNSVLGNPESNMKIAKNDVLTYPHNLMPANSSGIMNTCPNKTPQCEAVCLHTAGNPTHLEVKVQGRMARTYALAYARKAYIACLCFDIHNKISNAKGDIAFRLNTTSDIAWEKMKVNVDGVDTYLISHFSDTQFYDYTASFARAMKSMSGEWPSNYPLTLSLKENNDIDASQYLDIGGTVAACIDYKKSGMPSLFTLRNGRMFATFDGDKTDYRPEDPARHVIVLKPKGVARQPKYLGGFTRQV